MCIKRSVKAQRLKAFTRGAVTPPNNVKIHFILSKERLLLGGVEVCEWVKGILLMEGNSAPPLSPNSYRLKDPK